MTPGTDNKASHPPMTSAAASQALDYVTHRMQLRANFAGLTGVSSDALVMAALTGEGPYVTDYPWDRADWRRCLLAYALAPPWLRERMRPAMRSYRAKLDRRYWRWGTYKEPRYLVSRTTT